MALPVSSAGFSVFFLLGRGDLLGEFLPSSDACLERNANYYSETPREPRGTPLNDVDSEYSTKRGEVEWGWGWVLRGRSAVEMKIIALRKTHSCARATSIGFVLQILSEPDLVNSARDSFQHSGKLDSESLEVLSAGSEGLFGC